MSKATKQKAENVSMEAAKKILLEEEQKISEEFWNKFEALKKQYKRDIASYPIITNDGKIATRLTIVPIQE